MANNISEYVLNNTGQEVQQAITDALVSLPYSLGQKASVTEVLTKNNTVAYTPTSDYNPATKKYADGLRPEIAIGTVSTGNEGTNASVVNGGTNKNAILNFTIPRGYRGFNVGSVAKTSGTGAPGTTDTYTMYLNDGEDTPIGTFTVYNGTDANINLTLSNNVDSSLTITGSPLTGSGTINIRHANSITAQTTQAVYPIAIDRCGHITSYGEAMVVGNMFKSTYDANDNGIVDKAESLDNGINQLFFEIS